MTRACAARPKEVGAARPGDHLCLAFGTDEEQREVLATFIVAGLTNGEKVLYFSDGTAPEMVTGWLRAKGVDAGPAWARGQLELRDARQVHLSSGRFDPAQQLMALRAEVAAAQRTGFAGLRLTDEMTWALRGAPGSERLAEYEDRLQQLYDTEPATGICQYDQRVFGVAAAAELTSLHPFAVISDALHDGHSLRVAPMFHPRGLRVVGTVDISTSDCLATALARWTAVQPGDVYLDMTELEFIDVAGLRTLVRTARGLSNRRLRVVNLAPTLRHVVSLVGWDKEPGLVFDDEVVDE